jgi:hypothetical protein
VLDAQPSSARSPGRSGALVGLALLAQVVLLGPGCLPQEKLSSYSRAWTKGPPESSATGESTGFDASVGSGTAGGNGGSSSDPTSGSGGEFAGAGGTSGAEPDASTRPTSIDAGLTKSDAGAIPLTTSLTDAGTAPLGP